MRIGTNHGSLSARTLSFYGDTPRGMVRGRPAPPAPPAPRVAAAAVRIVAGLQWAARGG
jgi:hypothetical protein